MFFLLCGGPVVVSASEENKSVEFFALIRKLVREEAGQDATEYALLLGFVALAAAAIFPTVTDNIKTIWSVASTHLSNAAKAVR